MKAYWQRIAIRIDAFSLRERAAIFAAAVLVVLTLVNQLAFEPQVRRQSLLSEQIKQDRAKLAAIQAQIQESARSQTADPDLAKREQLKALDAKTDQLQEDLKALHKGLVSPADMPSLLEGLLKRHGKLRLVSLKTLAPEDLAAPKIDGKAAASSDKNTSDALLTEAVYKHGVEIVVQGGYLDMLNYMEELEAMPWQLFWAQAKLDADAYPEAKLALTLYTLSLEKKWLNM